MCCRTQIIMPLHTDLEQAGRIFQEMLDIVGFGPPAENVTQERFLTLPPPEPENEFQKPHARLLGAQTQGNTLYLRLDPIIGSHNAEEHYRAALSASIMFKMSVALAERFEAAIQQTSLMGACGKLSQVNGNRLAHYGEGQPIDFNALCPGFQDAFLRGGTALLERQQWVEEDHLLVPRTVPEAT